MNEDLYSGHILTGIEVKKAGWRKTAKDIAEEGAKATGISRDRASGQVLLLDSSLVRRLNNPEKYARAYMKSVTEPWSSSRNDSNGSRLKGNEYLLMYEDLVEYEKKMQEFGDEFWKTLNDDLFKYWPQIQADAKIDLNDRYQEHFPPLNELRERYSWKVWIRPLPPPTNPKDIRLTAPQEVFDRAVEEDRRNHKKKMANVIGGIADDIIKDTVEIADRFKDYQHNKDGRKGNKLPKGPGWSNNRDLADRIDKWNETFPDTALSDTAKKIRKLVNEVEQIGDGNLSDARKYLSGRDDSIREPIVEKLEDIRKTVEPATSRFEEWMKN